MKAKIIARKESMYFAGQFLYQIILNGQKVWLDPGIFKEDDIFIEEEVITFKEPFDDYFNLVQKSNQNGPFFTVAPGKNLQNKDMIVSESMPEYNTIKKSKTFNKIPSVRPDFHHEDIKSARESYEAEIHFIQQLLAHPLMSREQFNKVVTLSTQFFKDSHGGDTPELPEEEKIDLNLHKPQDVKKFLANFSSEGLKFLVHDIDVSGFQFDYDTVMNTCERYFKKFIPEVHLPKELYLRILNFAFNKNKDAFFVFNNKNYTFTWHHQELINWCYNNPGVSPFNNELFYNQMILPFRQSIRSKERELWPLVQSILTKKLGITFADFKIDVDVKQLDKAQFYNDIEKLIKGLGTIFNTILERKNRSVIIKIEFYHIDRKRYLTITHVGSPSIQPLTTAILSGDLHGAVRSFYQAYDYTIKAPHEGEIQSLSLLYDIHHPEDKFIKNYTPEGFTHIITL
ncbi:MAG: hypothetical protein WAT79_00535 [Saprospiraceae bacterium]